MSKTARLVVNGRLSAVANDRKKKEIVYTIRVPVEGEMQGLPEEITQFAGKGTATAVITFEMP